jgi:hypothetical protein
MLASIAAALVPRSSAKHATAAAAAAVVPVAAAQQGQIDIEGGSAARWEVDCDAESGKVVARRRAVAGGAARHGRTDEQHESTVSFVHGVPMPHFCGQRRWDELRAKLKGTLRPDDVVVSTYPKCGTTWTEQVVLLLLNGGNPSVLNPADKNSFNAETKVGKIWLEAMIDSERGHSGGEFQRIELRDFVALPSPRLIKTHNPVELFCGGDNGEGEPPPPAPSGPPPPCGGARVVYVSRNPMDACVSSYYHAFNPHKSGWPFDAWAAVWLAGCCAFGDWFSVTKGWHQLSTRFENVLFVQFEDLKASPRRTIRRIAAHIGEPLLPPRLPPPALLLLP